jgi:hypothetical protein
VEITILKEINRGSKIKNLLADQVMKTSTLLISLHHVKCNSRKIVNVILSQISIMSMKRRKVPKEMILAKIQTTGLVPQGSGIPCLALSTS